MSKESRIILALDGMKMEQCLHLCEDVGDRVYAVKIHALYDAYGPLAIQRLKAHGAPKVWVDAKLHDIPETVRQRAEALRNAGAEIITVHASGGVEMMRAAMLAFTEDGNDEDELAHKVFAVTVLTSLDEDDVLQVYNTLPIAEVIQLARLASKASADGIVCSGAEVGLVASRQDTKVRYRIVPGTRSAGANANDQKRVTTPGDAIRDGATHLVIGREVTKAEDPYGALENIERQIKEASMATTDA